MDAVKPSPIAHAEAATHITAAVADMRKEYRHATLNESDVVDDPFEQFARWFDNAVACGVHEPSAMCLATSDAETGYPSNRMVLLKGVDQRGFTWYTDYRSRKGHELEKNPKAALCFFWPDLERQVRVVGDVVVIDRAESEAYFNSRPVGSRVGAWTSVQSSVLPSREHLEAALEENKKKFLAGAEATSEVKVPLPDHWGGYRLVPKEIEFWQGRESRLHDRIQFKRDADGKWVKARLSP
jgi:pyridoxamine 5'-phosphate oxidase